MGQVKKWWWIAFVLAIACVIGWKEKRCQSQANQCRASYAAQAQSERLPGPVSVYEHAAEDAAIAAACEPNGYFCRLFGAANLPTVFLVIIGMGGIWAALRTLKAIEKQVDAMVNSERAWIDAEIVQPPKQLVKKPPHRLLVKNLGKTPAQLENYEVRIGPYLCQPFPESLQLSYEWNERSFIGSGESKPFGPEIDLDLMFDSLTAKGDLERLAFSVTVNYVDIVGGTEPRRTFVVYLYTPLRGTIERMGQFSNYK